MEPSPRLVPFLFGVLNIFLAIFNLFGLNKFFYREIVGGHNASTHQFKRVDRNACKCAWVNFFRKRSKFLLVFSQQCITGFQQTFSDKLVKFRLEIRFKFFCKAAKALYFVGYLINIKLLATEVINLFTDFCLTLLDNRFDSISSTVINPYDSIIDSILEFLCRLCIIHFFTNGFNLFCYSFAIFTISCQFLLCFFKATDLIQLMHKCIYNVLNFCSLCVLLNILSNCRFDRHYAGMNKRFSFCITLFSCLRKLLIYSSTNASWK